jgi:hypothetical protein
MRFMPSMVRRHRLVAGARVLRRLLAEAVGLVGDLRHLADGGGHVGTVPLVRWAATESDSALRATCAMKVAISSTVPEVSVTVPARCSRLRATWSMETVICLDGRGRLGHGAGEDAGRLRHLLDGGAHLVMEDDVSST